MPDPDSPGGCLFVQGALACKDSERGVRSEVSARRLAGENDIRARFEQAAEGDPDAVTDPAELAKFVTTLMWGMAVQSAGGAGRKELETIAAVALRGLYGRGGPQAG